MRPVERRGSCNLMAPPARDSSCRGSSRCSCGGGGHGTSSGMLLRASGAAGSADEAAAPPPSSSMLAREARTSYLDELRALDRQLQELHPAFLRGGGGAGVVMSSSSASSPSPTVSSWPGMEEAHPRLLALLALQAIASAIALELVFHVKLPVAVEKRLPPHAKPLLPKLIANRLRLLAVNPPEAVRPLEEFVRELGVPTASDAAVTSLLDRVQRSAEVWQLRVEAYRENHAAKLAEASENRALPRRSEIDTYASARFSTDATTQRSDEQQQRPIAGVSAPSSKHGGMGNGSGHCGGASSGGGSGGALRRAARWMRLLGMHSRVAEADYLRGKALVARAFALAIRRARPSLPPTAYEAAKVAHNTSVANAMLEAYARALATHAETAIAFYRNIAAGGRPPVPPTAPRAPPAAMGTPAATAAAPAPAALALMVSPPPPSSYSSVTSAEQMRAGEQASASACSDGELGRCSSGSTAGEAAGSPTPTPTGSSGGVGGGSLAGAGGLKLNLSKLSTSSATDAESSSRSSMLRASGGATGGPPTPSSASRAGIDGTHIPRCKWQIRMSEVRLTTRRTRCP